MQIDVSDAEFEDKVIRQSEKVPVVVDFWAPWCAPCNILGPVLKKLADEYKSRFILAKFNVSDNQRKAGEYGVMGIPAVKMIRNGEVVAEFTGARPETEVRQWLDDNLK